MVEEPGGDLWMNEDIKNRIRARLWRSWSLFEQTLKDIQIAINDMNERLGSGGRRTMVGHICGSQRTQACRVYLASVNI
ncbi:hypothetical protein TrVGV298_011484 [Trichoderma virens]|nr:hypothetical protein TrVGV298_011484 [Trichoderma virens]